MDYRDRGVFIQRMIGVDPLRDMMERTELVGMNLISFLGETDEPDEIRRYYSALPIEKTLVFDENRQKFKDLLRQISCFLFDNYGLPRNGIIEVGAGATGFFWAEMRPEGVTNWLQTEISPRQVLENRRRNPEAAVEEGSYLELGYRDVPLICGLSSLDTAGFHMGRAMDQIGKALGEDGWFLHIQDVRPGDLTASAYVKKKCGRLPRESYAVEDPKRGNVVLGFDLNGERITTVELFRRYIGEGIDEEPSLRPVLNHYVTIVEPCEDSHIPIHGFEGELYFFNSHTYLNVPSRAATVLVTLAQKVTE
jgi:hypothetical protein